MGTEKEKKPEVRILGDHCLRKCNIFHTENALSGPFKALKNQNSGRNRRSPIPEAVQNGTSVFGTAEASEASDTGTNVQK